MTRSQCWNILLRQWEPRSLLEYTVAATGTEFIVRAHCYNNGSRWARITPQQLSSIPLLPVILLSNKSNSSFETWVSRKQPDDVTVCDVVRRTPLEFQCTCSSFRTKAIMEIIKLFVNSVFAKETISFIVLFRSSINFITKEDTVLDASTQIKICHWKHYV